MAKKLVTNVYVHGTDDDKVKAGWYGPDHGEPDAATAKAITNPSAWGDPVEEREIPIPGPGQTTADVARLETDGDTGSDDPAATAKAQAEADAAAKAATAKAQGS